MTVAPIVRVAWQRYRVPFRACSFRNARASAGAREGIMLTIEARGGLIGYGEAAPFNGDGGDLDGAEAAIGSLSPAVLGMVADDAWLGLPGVAPEGGRTGLAAIETALADLGARQSGLPVSTWLAARAGLQPPAFPLRLPLNALVDANDIVSVERAVAEAVASGFRAIKLKVAGDPAEAAARVATARRATAPTIELRADANGAWTEDDARRFLAAVAECGLALLEEPVRPGDRSAFARLAAATDVVLAVDESCRTAEALDAAIAGGGVGAVVLKPAFSGLREALAILGRARSVSLPVIVTSGLEAGIGVAVAAHVAALAGPPHLAAGLATLDLLADDLVECALPILDGALTLTAAPGLGVELDRAALATHSPGPEREVRA